MNIVAMIVVLTCIIACGALCYGIGFRRGFIAGLSEKCEDLVMMLLKEYNKRKETNERT